MSYELVYTQRAGRDIAKPDQTVQKRIKQKLEKFSSAPFQYAER